MRRRWRKPFTFAALLGCLFVFSGHRPARNKLPNDLDLVIAIGNSKSIELVSALKDGIFISSFSGGNNFKLWPVDLEEKLLESNVVFSFYSKGAFIGKGTLKNKYTDGCGCTFSDVAFKPARGNSNIAKGSELIAVASNSRQRNHQKCWEEIVDSPNAEFRGRMVSAIRSSVVDAINERQKWGEPSNKIEINEPEIQVFEDKLVIKSHGFSELNKVIFAVKFGPESVLIPGLDQQKNWQWVEPSIILFENEETSLRILCQNKSENGIELIDLFDFDGDKVPELIFLLEGKDGYGYEIYQFKDNKLLLVAESDCGC